MSKNTVFDYFRLYIKFKLKWNTYRFVEQAKLYQMVYDSIQRIKKFHGEIFQLLIWHHRDFHEKWCEWALLTSNYPGFWTFWGNGLYMIRCRIKWATNWYKIYFGNRLLSYAFYQNTEKWSNFQMSKFNVFWLFCFNIMIERKYHIYSFVERVELYRLVYKSIF